MVGETTSSAGPNAWTDPERCPFCRSALASGGAGFIEHVDANDSCRTEFDRWRSNVSGDVGGEWVG